MAYIDVKVLLFEREVTKTDVRVVVHDVVELRDIFDVTGIKGTQPKAKEMCRKYDWNVRLLKSTILSHSDVTNGTFTFIGRNGVCLLLNIFISN